MILPSTDIVDWEVEARHILTQTLPLMAHKHVAQECQTTPLERKQQIVECLVQIQAECSACTCKSVNSNYSQTLRIIILCLY